MASMLTCITCRLAFKEADVQRVHYKSDWHKYNLKRKIVELPPVTAEEFKNKLQTQNAQIAKENDDGTVLGITCKVCNRRFHSFNSYKSHLQSKKHKEAEKKQLAAVSERVAGEQLQIEKDEDLDEEEMFEMEEKAVNKAVAEAKSNLNQPIVLKGDKKQAREEKEQKREKMEDLRRTWCEQQLKLIMEKEGKSVIKEGEEEKMEDGGWEDVSEEGSDCDEDMSDDGEWKEELVEAPETKEKDDTKSQGEASSVVASETSDLSGIMSRIKYDSDADVASVDWHKGKEDQRVIGLSECFFCCGVFASADDKIIHMTQRHSFFIPELQYITALDELLELIGFQIGVGNVCICCKKQCPSLSAVRSHMNDKGHCRMFVDGDAAMDYADYYDFSQTYPDADVADPDEELQMMSVDDVTAAPSSSSIGDTSKDDYEMVLPNGARIGTRKLWRYYKQNFPTVDRGLSSGKSRVQKLLSQYSSIGWHSAGADSVVVKKFRRDIKYAQHIQKKYTQQLGMKNNKTMMKHFRDPYAGIG